MISLTQLYNIYTKNKIKLYKGTFKVMVPMKPAFTMTGSFREFNASAFNRNSLRTTSPILEGRKRKNTFKKDFK